MSEPQSSKFFKITVALILSAFAIGSVAFSALSKPSGKATVNSETKSEIPVTTQIPEPAKRHVLVRYFHTAVRCSSCKTIEAYANEAIKGAFSAELKDGSLVWTSVNIENPGFEHFIQDFQLTNKSIIITEENTTKPRQWKNLQRVWEMLNDKAAFINYVQQEIRSFLKGS